MNETVDKCFNVGGVTGSFDNTGQHLVGLVFAEEFKLVPNISLQMLEAEHERKVDVGGLENNLAADAKGPLSMNNAQLKSMP